MDQQNTFRPNFHSAVPANTSVSTSTLQQQQQEIFLQQQMDQQNAVRPFPTSTLQHQRQDFVPQQRGEENASHQLSFAGMSLNTTYLDNLGPPFQPSSPQSLSVFQKFEPLLERQNLPLQRPTTTTKQRGKKQAKKEGGLVRSRLIRSKGDW